MCFNSIDIPTYWKKDKIRYCFTLDVGLSITKENLCTNGIKCINYGYIHRKGTFHLDLQRDVLPFAPTKYLQTNVKSLVKTGDFVFCDTSEDIEGSGNFVCILNDCDEKIFAGSHTIACKKVGNFNSKFLAYFCATDLWKSQIQSKVSGTKVYSITQKILKECLVFFPLLETQQRIADFLDTKCTHIDDTITKEKELIEKLKEYRQSVITEAVTKGLDENTPMKDSGIDWIGKIPEHWRVLRLKNIGESIIGLTYSPEDVADQGTLVLRSSNIQKNKLCFEDNVYVQKNINDKLFVKKGDILICSRNGSRNLIGKNAIIDESLDKCSFGAFMTIYRTKYYNFCSYIFNSSLFSFHLSTFLTSTINQLTIGNLNSITIALPPFEEQQEIAAYLDKKTTLIDHAISQKEQLIEKLNQYKKSLIYEAVTGKMVI